MSSAARIILIAVIALPLIFPAGTAHAAVPVWVVEFDANTDFERSLEAFMFQLFNKLQQREEDFIAAFELQKIEKAREDVNKLFQETQEELQDFGLAFDVQAIQGSALSNSLRDPRFAGDEKGSVGPEDCNPTPTSAGGINVPPGCPPVISPIKDSRIIHDPYQYLFGDAQQKARLFLYCFFNYTIWDQFGLLGDAEPGDPPRYPFMDKEPKRTYDGSGDPDPTESTIKSAKAIMRVRNQLVVIVHRGHYDLLNYPYQDIYGNIGNLNDYATLRNAAGEINTTNEIWQRYDKVEPRCRQLMYIVAGESPVTVQQDIELWKLLTQQNGLEPTQLEEETIRSVLWFLPTLKRSTLRRPITELWTWDEFRSSYETSQNDIRGLERIALEWAQKIIDETEREREATYIAGQGLRPEYLYVTRREEFPGGPAGGGTKAHFDLNTEYVISPAVMLLQKMQASTQSMFDLAGQGFLYLDPEATEDNLLAEYNLVSTAANEEERKICNNAGSCVLLDPWLKPAASFRTAAVIEQDIDPATGSPTGPLKPQLVGPDSDRFFGSGLPAPWEDAGDYLDLGNEKQVEKSARRYTVARFRADRDGTDEFDDTVGPIETNLDNIESNLIGRDFAINDWYDRVFEMYESGAGLGVLALPGGPTGSIRKAQLRQFHVSDWQCYVATWFFKQNARSGGVAGPGGSQFVPYYVGLDPLLNDTSLFDKYCVENP